MEKIWLTLIDCINLRHETSKITQNSSFLIFWFPLHLSSFSVTCQFEVCCLLTECFYCWRIITLPIRDCRENSRRMDAINVSRVNFYIYNYLITSSMRTYSSVYALRDWLLLCLLRLVRSISWKGCLAYQLYLFLWYHFRWSWPVSHVGTGGMMTLQDLICRSRWRIRTTSTLTRWLRRNGWRRICHSGAIYLQSVILSPISHRGKWYMIPVYSKL